MKGIRLSGRIRGSGGFSLIEVMVVMVIVAILATGVVFMFANPTATVKTQAFELLGEFNRARSEAVTKNEDVLVYFLDDVSEECQNDISKCTVGGNFDGYIICVDLDSPLDGECDPTDTIIKTTLFRDEVQYYDPTSLPSGGPSTTPTIGSTANNLIGGSGIMLDNGTPVNDFSMQPDGTLEDAILSNINVVIYVPKQSHNEIYGKPYAVIVASTTGGVSLRRWANGAWKTK